MLFSIFLTNTVSSIICCDNLSALIDTIALWTTHASVSIWCIHHNHNSIPSFPCSWRGWWFLNIAFNVIFDNGFQCHFVLFLFCFFCFFFCSFLKLIEMYVIYSTNLIELIKCFFFVVFFCVFLFFFLFLYAQFLSYSIY